MPVFVWSPEEEGTWPPGSASKWWLHQSLHALAKDLEGLGTTLIVRRGPAHEVLVSLAQETGADVVLWSRRYEPSAVSQEQRVADALDEIPVAARGFKSNLLFEPDEISTTVWTPYKVFTPFYRQCMSALDLGDPLPAPDRLEGLDEAVTGDDLEDLGLEPTPDWAATMRETWRPGGSGAHERLSDFLEGAARDYGEQRDRPDVEGTSRLSPHLHFGEISPRRVWHETDKLKRRLRSDEKLDSIESFLRQLIWREFAHHILHHFPHTSDEAMKEPFADFPWRSDAEGLQAWQRGLTGYPIVDAGMRELWATGWMHNRVRMIVASFLTKDLLIPWQEGARWFWDTLVDADLANNSLGWQWVAGSGADAAPYFRIFNPITQGKKFDPDGVYIRRWVPELSKLPNPQVHEPWKASAEALTDARIRLGESYPLPIVDHAEARQRALSAFDQMRS